MYVHRQYRIFRLLIPREARHAAQDSLVNRSKSSDIQEARVLMNNKAEMTLDDLREVLLENEVKSFDPVAEAFKV